jgi:threonine dehydrogenase-like Zn-dependent dehydrogenase
MHTPFTGSSAFISFHVASKVVRAGLTFMLACMLVGTAQQASAASNNTSTTHTPLVLAPQAGAVPTPEVCFATIDGIYVYSSINASALQQAVDAAAPGATVKVAGLCAGVQTRAGETQTVYISKTLTLEGGYTNTPSGWSSVTQPTTQQCWTRKAMAA